MAVTWRKSTSLGILALGMVLSGVASSQETAWYDIEIIVFENTDPGAGLSETWPDDPGFPSLESAKELIPLGADPVIISELEPQGSVAPALHALESGGAQGPSGALDEEQAPGIAGEPAALPEPLPVEVWVPFLMRPPESYRLNDIARKLDRSKRYRVLTHTSWRQALERGAAGTAVHFHSDMDNIETYQRLTRPDLNAGLPLSPNVATFEADAANAPASTDQGIGGQAAFAQIQPAGAEIPAELQRSAFPLDGTLTVRLSRYLHLDADLIWQRLEESREPVMVAPQAEETAAEEEAIEITMNGAPMADQSETFAGAEPPAPVMRMRSYRLQESRRMRSKELHYLDHPVYGILALITPVDEAAKSAEEP